MDVTLKERNYRDRPHLPQRVKMMLALKDGELTAAQVFERAQHTGNKENTRIILCRLVRKGLIKNMGTKPCKTCFLSSHMYKLTPLGRQYLEDYIN